MSLVQKVTSLLDEKNQTSLSSNSTSIVFDSTISISKDRAASVSSHAVEKGAQISDHITTEPTNISVTAVITDADWDPLDPFSFLNKTVSDRLGILKDWMDDREVLIFNSYEGDYENLIIESLTEEQSVELGKGRQISLKLKEIVIVSSNTTATPVGSEITKAGATSTATTQISGSAGITKPMSAGVV
ncbi:hypothetical protein EHQ53_03185 [Leptospira langatensis]|uniref:Dit-like phage tail protein N-terminal domain-containing protein n=1 Tax=Leptospira langatensis TaxID=2484983 RepID=A0A5F1ZXY1_9LEPT|nr:hypothetical protein [Leptospira langatensis]TGK04166.1 hypothetical protein EHO57_03415 [Leptospira langatensis]TGL43646.1 hypothetical protein EHQ53_03185 [Leptospira langatensis]